MSQINNPKGGKESNDKFIKITSTGVIEFDIVISLSETEAEQMQLFPDQINTIKDCKQFFCQPDLDEENMTYPGDIQKKANIYIPRCFPVFISRYRFIFPTFCTCNACIINQSIYIIKIFYGKF